MKNIIKVCKCKRKNKSRKQKAIFGFWIPGLYYVTGDNIMADLQSGLRGAPTVVWRDIRGNVASVDPTVPIVWTVVNPAFAQAYQDEAGKWWIGGLLVGITEAVVRADADLDLSGFKEVEARLPLNVTAGQAAGGDTGFAGSLEPDPGPPA